MKRISINFLSKIAILVLLVYLNLYFLYGFIYGSKGYIEYFRTNSEYTNIKNNLDKVKEEHIFWIKKVNSLNPQSPDLDVLEYQARKVFSYGIPGEISIFENQ